MSGAGSSSRQFLSSVANNPRSGWLEYLGLPEDLDEWTVEDVRSTAAGLGLSALVGPATAPAADASKANGAPIPPAAPTPALTLHDFQSYLQRVGEPYRFLASNRPGADEPLPTFSSASAEALAAVPEVCFRADFSLADPETFDVFSPPGAPAAGMVMVEKLTHYLDQVELTLLGEVATRSEGFFEALQSYHALKREVGAGVAAIETLRGRLRALEANLVHKSLRLPRLVRQRKNLEAVETRVRLLHAVWRTQPTIQQLLGAGDFPGALELIASSQQLLDTDLAGVASLAHLSSSLRETKASIQRTMNRDLLQVALGYDLDDGPPAVPVEALGADLTAKLAPIATGLLRLGVLHDGLTELLEQQKKDVRALVKRTVREGLRDVDDRKKVAAAAAAGAERAAAAAAAAVQASLADSGVAPAADEAAAAEPAAAEEPAAEKSVKAQLAELGADEFEGVMAVVSEPLLVVLRRAAAIHAALQRACAAAAADGTAYKALDDSGDASVPYHARIEGQSAEMLHAVCELAHERYARVLKTRRDAHARLPLGEFVRVTKTAVEFVRDVQHLAGRACVALTTELQAGARAFLEAKHDDASRKLDAIVEMEQWKQVDVAPEFQEIVDALQKKQVPRIAEAKLVEMRERSEVAEAVAAATAATDVQADGAGYKVVPSVLLLLTIVTQYMQAVANVPSVAAQVASCLPALLKLFNTKAYKQVLMAGAMMAESAGLKRITSPHLALASQALGLALALMPHLKAILAAYLPEAQRPLLREMDSAIVDFEQHQQQLFDKLVSILDEKRLATHMPTLAPALVPSADRARPETTPCAKAVAKDIAAMHRLISPLLTRAQLHAVFAKVVAKFDGGLLAAYQGVDTAPVFTRQCIVQDVHFLRTEVGKLNLALPQGVFPDLVGFAQGLPLA